MASSASWGVMYPMIRQSDGDDSSGNLVSQVGDEIKVTLDRWSVGQLGVSDLVVAGAVVVVGALIAWLASGIAKRIARRFDGAARAAVATVGLLLGSSIVLLAVAIALEVLGFSLGPILVLILIVVAALLLLRPLMTNLSSGVLLQVRGALAAGDLILSNDELGTVYEINARSVVLETSDGRRVHLPNSDVLNGIIENYSSLERRRSSFDLMVETAVDIDQAIDVIARAAASVEAVLDDPPPVVRTTGIVGKWFAVEILVWHPPAVQAGADAVDDTVRAVVRACSREGISLDGPEWMAIDAGATRIGRT